MRRALVIGSSLGLCACGTVLGLPDPELDESIGKESSATGQGGGATSTGTAGEGPGGAGGAAGAGNGGGGTGGGGGSGGSSSAAVQLNNARVRRIELDGADIYWTEDLDARIGKMGKDGSNPVILANGLAAAGFFPHGLALDATDVYWSSSADGIRKCAKAGCGNQPTVLINDTQGFSPGGIEVDDQFVWFGNYVDSTNGTLHKMPKSGGAPTEVLDATEFCPGSIYNRIDLVGGFIYFTCESGFVGRMSTSTEMVEVLSGPTPPIDSNAFVVSGQTIYYAQFLDMGSVFALSTSGYQAGFDTIALGQVNTNGITADNLRLYWLNVGGPLPDNGTGTLVRCSISDCNGTVETIEAFQDIPQAPVNDATHVYWSNWGNGFTPKSGIFKKPK